MKKTSVLVVIVLVLIHSFFLFFQNIGTKIDFQSLYVDLNPYEISPLTGILDVNINAEGIFNIKILPKDPQGVLIEYSVNYMKGDTKVPIYGLYSNFNNQVEVEFIDKNGKNQFLKTFQIKTDPYSGPDIELQVNKNKIGRNYQGLYGFMDKPILFDQNGDIRWYLENEEYSMLFSQLDNGNFLISSELESIRYHKKHFYEINLFGEEIKKYTVPNLFHHEILELENGNFLTSSNSDVFTSLTDNIYREDTIIEIDRNTGDIIDVFNLSDVLEELKPKVAQGYSLTRDWGDYDSVELTTGDWVHINSLYMSDGEVIASLRNTDMIIGLDMHNKSLNWILTHRNEYETLEPFILDVKGEINEFLYPLVQHSAILDNDGNMYTFDNGVGRSTYYGDVADEKKYSRVLRYSLDTDKGEALLDFSYISEDLIYTPSRGNVVPLVDSILIGYTYNAYSTPRMVELNGQGDVILDIQEMSGDTYYRVVQYNLLKAITKI